MCDQCKLRIPFKEAISEPLLLKNRWDSLSTAQQVALKGIYGLPLASEEEHLIWSGFQGEAHIDDLGYQTHVNKIVPYSPKAFREAWLIVGRRGSKALDISTPIPTPSGWTTMGQLKEGDQIFAPDGSPTTITSITPVMEGKECFRLIFSDREEIIADAEHNWEVWDKSQRKHGSSRTKVLKTFEMAENFQTPSGESRYAIYNALPWQYPEKVQEIPPYLLGIWLGDGTTKRAEITTADREVVAAFEAEGYVLAERDRGITFGVNGQKKFDNKQSFYCQLTRLGVLGNKHIPDNYLFGSVAQRIALLQGLMDSDGHCKKNGGCIFTNTNKRLAEQMLELVRSLGIPATFVEGDAKLYGRFISKTYRVNFRPHFPVFRLGRKAEKQQKSNPNVRYIRKIEKIPSVPVRCLTVAHPSHLFLAGRSGIPTHNTDSVAATAVAYEAAFGGHEEFVRPGQEIMCFQIAQDLKMAMYSLHFIRAALESSPIGKSLVEYPITKNFIRLKNGVTVVCYPPTLKSVRGYANPIAVLDEVGVWYQDSDSANPDYEIYRAIRPAQIQFRHPLILGLSSAWNKNGMIYRYYEAGTDGKFAMEAEKEEFANALVIHATTAMFQNPHVKREDLAADRAKDQKAFEREFLSIFQDSISGFLNSDLVKKAVTAGVYERPPDDNFLYVAALDPAFRHDAFAFTIFHATPDGRIVQDVVRQWIPQANESLSPEAICNEIGQLVNKYNVMTVYSDQYHMESLQQIAIRSGFTIEGVVFTGAKKASLYGSLQQLVNQQRIELVDHKEQYKELTQLEKSLSVGGTIKISAPSGRRDDLATVVALAAHHALLLIPDQFDANVKKENDAKTPFELCMEQVKRRKGEENSSFYR